MKINLVFIALVLNLLKDIFERIDIYFEIRKKASRRDNREKLKKLNTIKKIKSARRYPSTSSGRARKKRKINSVREMWVMHSRFDPFASSEQV